MYKEFKYNINDRLYGMYTLLESSVLYEGLFKKKDKRPVLDTEYRCIIKPSEMNKYQNMFKDLVNYSKTIVNKEIPNAELSKINLEPKIKEYSNGYTEYSFFTNICNIKLNFDKFTSKSKTLKGKNFDDVDGDKLCSEIEKRLLSPFKNKGFKKADYTYGVMNFYIKDDAIISVFVDEDYEMLSISMRFYVDEN